MKLIIEIDEDDYTMCQILAKEMCDTRMKLTDNLKYAISNGIPLPEGHGRLIDAKVAYKKFYSRCYASVAEEILNEVPTIIEADKAERSE